VLSRAINDTDSAVMQLVSSSLIPSTFALIVLFAGLGFCRQKPVFAGHAV